MPNFFKNILNRPKLKNLLSGDIEAGYSLFGPTLRLEGTLYNTEHVAFITSVAMAIIYAGDKTMHAFNWLALLPQRFRLTSLNPADLKMPSKVLVTPTAPFAYNILFADTAQYSAMKQTLTAIKQNWDVTLNQLVEVHQGTDQSKRFSSFLQQPFTRDAHGKLGQFCYWKEGDYLLSMIFIGKDNQELLETRNGFSLNGTDADGLKKNPGMIIADLCRQPQISYFNAYARLKNK